MDYSAVNSLPLIPKDMLNEIYKYLDLPSLAKLARVCKIFLYSIQNSPVVQKKCNEISLHFVKKENTQIVLNFLNEIGSYGSNKYAKEALAITVSIKNTFKKVFGRISFSPSIIGPESSTFSALIKRSHILVTKEKEITNCSPSPSNNFFSHTPLYIQTNGHISSQESNNNEISVLFFTKDSNLFFEKTLLLGSNSLSKNIFMYMPNFNSFSQNMEELSKKIINLIKDGYLNTSQALTVGSLIIKKFYSEF